MAYFVRDANTFRVAPEESMDLHKTLPVGNYVLKASLMGLYLESVDAFPLPSKVYGDTNKHSDRILRTFMARASSTGVLLSGEKGSGKTLLAKTLATDAAAKYNVPTIVINEPFHGDAFNTFMQQIEQPTMVLFDEFEKVYDNDDQEAALTLLDGVFPSKKLFVFTCNDKWRINAHMRNRPGRIFYMLEYSGLPMSFIREYCQDNLTNKTHVSKVCEIVSLFSEFNFDMLKALVEEMNRYNEAPQEALRWLNAKPEYMGGTMFDVALFDGKKKVKDEHLHDKQWSGNPLNGEIEINWFKENKRSSSEDDDEDREFQESTFTSSDIKKVDADAGEFTFVNSDGIKLVLTRKQYTRYDYLDSF